MKNRYENIRYQIYILCAFSFFLLEANVFAQTEDQDAIAASREHMNQAQIDFNLGRFNEAVHNFSMAYELYRAPAFLYNIGQCYRELQNYERALFFFNGYLRESPDAPNREDVENLIEEINEIIQSEEYQQRLETQNEDPNLESSQDQENEPEPPRQNDLQTTASEDEQIVLQTTAPVDEQNKTRTNRRFYKKWWFWTIIATVASGAVVAGVVSWSVSQEEEPTQVLPEGSAGTMDWR